MLSLYRIPIWSLRISSQFSYKNTVWLETRWNSLVTFGVPCSLVLTTLQFYLVWAKWKSYERSQFYDIAVLFHFGLSVFSVVMQCFSECMIAFTNQYKNVFCLISRFLHQLHIRYDSSILFFYVAKRVPLEPRFCCGHIVHAILPFLFPSLWCTLSQATIQCFCSFYMEYGLKYGLFGLMDPYEYMYIMFKCTFS